MPNTETFIIENPTFLPVFRNEKGRKLVLEAYEALMNTVGIPYEELYLPTRLGLTHITVTGKQSSPPLLLMHAYYATAASWYRNLKALSASHLVYNIDIIGDPNKSQATKVVREEGEFVLWLNDVMQGLNLARAAFIGNSVGAFHIVNFAISFPNKVDKMILIGPAATFMRITPFYLHTFPGGVTGWSFLVGHAVNWIESNVRFDPAFRKLFYLCLKHGKSVNQVFPRVFSDEELKGIQTPTLLIYGDHEVIYDYRLAIERAKQHLPNLGIALIERGNHITAATNYDAVNRSILAFLEDGVVTAASRSHTSQNQNIQ